MPEWTSDIRRHLAGLRLTPAREAAIVDELAQHLDDRYRELVGGGMTEAAATEATRNELRSANRLGARLAVLRQAHSVEPIALAAASSRPLGGLVHDMRYSIRSLMRQPGLLAIAIVTLAFGIGLTTAMFSFVNALLLRPLPFPDADRIVRLYRATPQNPYGGFAPADFIALTQQASGFGRFAAYQQSNITFSEPGRSTQWVRISADMLDVLGVAPAMGRPFHPDEHSGANARVVIISDALWRDRFASAPDIIGQTVRGNNDAYEIVGVLPPAAGDHRFLGQVGFFSPLALDADAAGRHTPRNLSIVGRRTAEISQGAATAMIAAAGTRMAADYPRENENTTWRSEGLPVTATGPAGRVLLSMLLGLSGFVLLIACSNLANLLLARTMERTRELAVRAALGASRLQLVRTPLLECAIMAVIGGAGALLVAVWTTAWLRSVIASGGGPSFQFPLDWRVVGFASAVSLFTIVMCGVGPAIFTSRIDTNETLKSSGRGTTPGRGQRRFRHALVVGQFTLAMTLLAGAGFFLRGAANLLHDHAGWSADRVIQAEVSMPAMHDRTPASIVAFQQRLLDAVGVMPGVEAVSISYGLPYLGLRGDGRYSIDAGGSSTLDEVSTKLNGVSTSYFDVTGTRLVAGRVFGSADTTTAPKVAIINDAMARALFPSGNAVGSRLKDAGSDHGDVMEIVGVVGDVRSIDVAQPRASYQLYQPTAQDPHADFVLAVRSSAAEVGRIAGSLSRTIADLDSNATVRALMPVNSRMAEVTSQMAMVQQLLAAFALLGLLLAALGIYSAMTRMVAQRTSEIGLRMALGAQVSNVIRMVLGSGGWLVGVGGAAGLLGAFGLSRVLQSVLPTMRTDSSFVGVTSAALLVLIAMGACYLPAIRATKINPIDALRAD